MNTKINIKSSEIWDLYDENLNKTGKVYSRDSSEPIPTGMYHVVVTAIVMAQDSGKILLTQRAGNKNLPFKWELSGGCVQSQEGFEEAIIREVAEETGIHIVSNEIKKLDMLDEKGDDWFLFSYLTYIDAETVEIKIQDVEVQNYKWVTLQELKDMNDAGVLMPKVYEKAKLVMK